MSQLIFLSGSIRKDSLNTKLAKYACEIAKNHKIDAEFIDLTDYEMPIYNGDFEQEYGLPENAIKLKEKFVNCRGFFIASPEYNGSFSALLKNTIDWLSRPNSKTEQPLIAFKGKFAAISAASPGALGGLRGLVPLRLLLSNIGVIMCPSQLALGNAFSAFSETNQINDVRQDKMLQNIISELIELSK